MVSSLDELLAADAARDVATCGCSLAQAGHAACEDPCAHEPTPTPYFVLEELFANLGLRSDSHLLDVGCGTGRVLAHVLGAGLPGYATGVELDSSLAAYARSWAHHHPRLRVIEASALEIPLAPYTHLYLFNPFDNEVLLQFLAKLEVEAAHPVTLVHMSDNGENYSYMGRRGWSLEREGEFHMHPADGGGAFAVFGCPQHFSIWRFDPAG